MKLQTLIADLTLKAVGGDLEKDIESIVFDSRRVKAGSLFVAVKGARVDGHDFLDDVLEQGAAAVIVERLPDDLRTGATYLVVDNSAAALGMVAANFYGHPSTQLQLVGVTGTNGKTTTATLLYQLFTGLGYKTGLLSTVENRIGALVLPATYTTPDAVAVQELLAEMVAAGCTYVFMEVSSHAIDQERTLGLQFAGGIFTNITHDHLDYHGTFNKYIEAKKRFFDNLTTAAFALVNIDDKHGEVMVQNTRAKVKTYSLRTLADFRAKVVENSLSGLHLEIERREFFGRLIGKFNAYNLLAAYATAVLLGQDAMEVLQVLSSLGGAEGRFDYQFAAGRQITGIVDYAHTPDALEKVLSTIHDLRAGSARIITVVGCGGDRDRAKRPIMAKVACDYSDQVIFTSDNPRTEDPAAILADMEKGVPAYAKQKTLIIPARKEAIRTACRLAGAGDIILLAGKGHEKYQEIMGVKYPFDDKEILREALAE